MQVLEVGQVWKLNRGRHPGFLVHVLAIFEDKLEKPKIAIHIQTTPQKGIRPTFFQAKIVSPQYFYGMTVELNRDRSN